MFIIKLFKCIINNLVGIKESKNIQNFECDKDGIVPPIATKKKEKTNGKKEI